LDEFARWLASPVSRRSALRLGAGAFAMALVPLRPRTAFAQGTAFAQTDDITCSPDTQFCRAYTCPSGTTCCPTPDNHLHNVYCPSGPCCNPCSPSSSQCDGNGNCVAGPVANDCPCTAASGGVVCGSDCCRNGQVCCHTFFASSADHCCTPDQQWKGGCGDVIQESYIAGAVKQVAAAELLGGRGNNLHIVVQIVVGGVAQYFSANGYGICADDPPDPNFQGIYVPKVPRLPRAPAGPGLTSKAARALRRMSANYVRFAAYMIAWIRSMEKAQGAEQANDDGWARRHHAAAAKYARTAATALGRDHELRTEARRALNRAGFRDLKVTSAQVRKMQHEIKAHGLPHQMEKILREAKVDAKQRQALRHGLLQLNPKAVAHFGLFGELDDKRFQQANAAMVKSMRQSADSLSAAA
jgi:hypothetical protein